ncbi:universal stress protein [Streptomyces sp. MS06]|uniref:universal stress protein n=1 Tax=Streptomyces sp. MS06 TaxID=3385974 RepID=UPI00399FCD01
MLLPVIAGVDGSPESLAAACWAAREADRRRLPLRLVHASDPRPRRTGGAFGTAGPGERARSPLRQARDRVRAACPGVPLDEQQAEGDATAALLRAAEQSEMLVLGSRGLSGFTGFLVGSVALGVAARARRPVVLVRAGEEAADEHLPAAGGGGSTTTRYRDVVLGVDLDAPCDELIEFAFESARTRAARLRVVHAWQQSSPFGLGPGEIGLVDGPLRAREWHGFLTAVLQVWREKYPEVEVVETVTEGRAAHPLVRAASAAGLLVVGRHLTGRSPGPRTGPVAHSVIQHAGCPVAVVPHE